MRRPDETALEYLVREAMASGAACFNGRAQAGEVDLNAPLDEAFGDFPKQWIQIRSDLVDDVLNEEGWRSEQ